MDAPDPAGAVFDALGDPTRRAIVSELGRSDSVTATQLAQELPMSRQAVAKHLAALSEAGLVHSARVGRETRYRLDPGALDVPQAWLGGVARAWDGRLERLRRLVED